ncbi:uncharacterized protein LOC141660936 [Apium graveolens]|uniref:uncharacterized protein LOC141660936 n=1 Tax=Apium graveolens TaxID=4045 RepID=UPI003D7BAA3D
MQQNFQDALAVCRYVGHPDVFLTMTCNPIWDEILRMMEYLPGCSPINCPDIISRVFKLKLDQLRLDVQKRGHFGKCAGVIFVVEFQKRGLPHIHMLIWLDKDSKKYLKENVDKFVSGEFPDPDLDPVGYAAVKEFMIHGPCGLQNPKSPCMKDMRCIRHYPKRYCDSTTFDSSGFPIYMRRRQHISVNVHNADLDNQWVVPYNRDLLVKKKKKNDDLSDDVVDEINSFFDGRYLCGAESAWRIFGFPIHCRTISVERLPFHLPNQKNCTFRANESLAKVASQEKYRLSKLEAFFLLNTVDHLARNYTYDEIPQHYVWDDKGRQWNKRKRGRQIGRLCYVHHSSGEPWFLRLLLTKVKGPTSFEDIMTVNGMRFTTFKDACKEYGLLDDDREWHEVMSQCAVGGLPPQMRQLFVHIIVNCKVADILDLWNCHWQHMVEDILLKRRHKTNNAKLILNEKQLQFYVLAELNDLLRSVGKSLKNFDQLPQPPDIYLNHGSNNLIIEETCYDTLEMAEHHRRLLSSCNSDQLRVYEAVIEAVNSEAGGLFFVSGSGGSGKTYLWRTLIYRLRSEGRIVLPVATSGIVATLMPGGRTAHSRFKIPIVLDEFSLCNISHDSDIARLIKKTKLIIWDEAPMQHRYAFECLDRSLRDIMKSVHLTKADIPFGGVTVLGGDFRQILHVIPLGNRAEVVSACITRSCLWDTITYFDLKQNMRLKDATSDAELQQLQDFSRWVHHIGEGTTLHDRDDLITLADDEILIPEIFCDV